MEPDFFPLRGANQRQDGGEFVNTFPVIEVRELRMKSKIGWNFPAQAAMPEIIGYTTRIGDRFLPCLIQAITLGLLLFSSRFRGFILNAEIAGDLL